jgi:hypothetical protein
MADEAWWESASDDDLVSEAGLSGARTTPGGYVPSDPRGYQAQAELTRRLTFELRETREELHASGSRIARLTWWLVVLTLVLVALTVVLLVRDPLNGWSRAVPLGTTRFVVKAPVGLR